MSQQTSASTLNTTADIFTKINGPLVFAGECMLELVNQSETQLGKSFAGDLYNSSVYLKRAFPAINVEFMSCIGNDMLSSELLARLHAEKISTQFLPQISTHHLGSYMVVTDEFGERSFIYWRGDSAAKRMVSALSAEQSLSLDDSGMFFFSGISIAILLDEERELFWQKLEQMQQAGVVIAFDPNYRPQLWRSAEIAKLNIEKAFQLADVLLPGVDDFQKLYGISDVEQCIELCMQYNPQELVMKQGEKNVLIVNAQGREVVPIVPNDNVVDTTSAGDAFNGVYIGARASGFAPKTAALAASAAASKVIETPGAIMPKELFDNFWKSYNL
ncbi:sugar kinase [Aliiglaciecola lipolytica]|uniref:2-dehydro-3-deoxygluconokinase n=1 Tax=Aliiglaciecola lipolytica E3 TaxID=1127673 RepID=K6XUL6_9ALTE|nr:sugar kinase [Aliiglaciecola lipolytica]GAC15346.1 2-dehydro-3-deoxygluconokinase [Aliiglaciecola lipolytica E3]